jgi:hypothetical protein
MSARTSKFRLSADTILTAGKIRDNVFGKDELGLRVLRLYSTKDATTARLIT